MKNIMKNNKKRISLILSLVMMLSIFPQISFAGDSGDSSVDWAWFSGNERNVGKAASETIVFYGMDAADIGVRSSNESVIPEECFWVGGSGPYGSLHFFPIGAGTTEITLYNKNDSSVESQTETITVKDATSQTVYVGAGAAKAIVDSTLPFEVECAIEDESIATIDKDGKVMGIKAGSTILNVKSSAIASMDINIPITVQEDPTGIYYNDERVTELDWDAKQQGSAITLSSIKYLNGPSVGSTLRRYYYSTNTDVVEPEYRSGNEVNHQGTGTLNVKKNGTAVIYVWYNTQHTQLIGTLTIHVTGCEETTDPDEGWLELEKDEAQGSKDGVGATIQLANEDYTIYNYAYDEATLQNRIAQYLKADTAAFSLRIRSGYKVDGGSSDTDMGFTDEDKAAWEEEVLKLINICEVNEDGTIGKVVASNGAGYELRSSSHTADRVDITLNLAVKAGTLSKGKTYALVADANVTGIESFADVPVNNPIGTQISWQFTTIGGAGTVDLDRASASLKPGETMTLTATMNKDSGVEADDVIAWSSSDTSIATVDNNGVVTAKKPGTVTITATAVDGGVSAKCTLTVEPIKSTDITLSSRAATLYVGKTLTLKATVYPTDATDKTVTWSSSNSKVASVDKNGKVTAKKAGTAVITARTADGLSTSATITVKNVKVTGVKLNAKKVTRTVGKTKQLKATVRPSNATNKGVTWTSSNKKVATVTSKGKVRAKSPGKATITVKTKDGKYKAKAVITVKPKNTSFTLKGNASSVVVTYKKRAGIDGYQIYRSEKKKGGYERVTTRTKKKGGQYTSVGVRANRTYYYKMRTYKVVKGKKIYSTFSAAKKVRTR